MEASVGSVSSSLVFFFFGGGVKTVKKMCTSAPNHITRKTWVLGAHVF